MPELIPALIKTVSKEFDPHLCLPGNDRIILSGRFGKGKTTFLHEFFSEKKAEYNAFFIDPVNYTVASNEDIFRYIKYDILLSMLEQRVPVEGVEFSYSEAASYYLARHPGDFIRAVIGYIPKTGKLVSSVAKHLEALHEKIKDFHTDINNSSDEAKILAFLDEMKADRMSIYENDVITQIIRQMLCSLKTNNDTVQNILVIDNLDRIDPEHIFRILNIFSAHFEYSKDRIAQDKFGFDKVIVVCDMLNIQNIYENRYGSNVDFNGYINKFYSNQIFYFQNYEQVKDATGDMLSNLVIALPNKPAAGTLGRFAETKLAVYDLAVAMIYDNKLSLRQLLNFSASPLQLRETSIAFNGHYLDLRRNPVLLDLIILSKLFGSVAHLHKALLSLSLSHASVAHLPLHFRSAAFFDSRHIHKFGSYNSHYNLPDIANVKVTLQSEGSYIRNMELSTRDVAGNHEWQPTPSDYFRILMRIVDQLHHEKIIE